MRRTNLKLLKCKLEDSLLLINVAGIGGFQLFDKFAFQFNMDSFCK